MEKIPEPGSPHILDVVVDKFKLNPVQAEQLVRLRDLLDKQDRLYNSMDERPNNKAELADTEAKLADLRAKIIEEHQETNGLGEPTIFQAYDELEQLREEFAETTR